MKIHTLIMLSILLLFAHSCISVKTDKANVADFELGEKWIWEWSRSSNDSILFAGEDMKEVVNYDGTLGFWNGSDTFTIASTLIEEESPTPFRDWPLYTGKTWRLVNEYENYEGTTFKQDYKAEVVAYELFESAAGSFMAYKIEYRGNLKNSRGYNAEVLDIWWYSPVLKTYVKHLYDDGQSIYVNELVAYSKSNKKS